jgi:hypothetical protein
MGIDKKPFWLHICGIMLEPKSFDQRGVQLSVVYSSCLCFSLFPIHQTSSLTYLTGT